MLKRTLLATVVAATVLAGAAYAQAQKGPNGGAVVKASGHPIEFVARNDELVFYLGDDDGSPLPTRRMTGRAVVQDGDKTSTITLSPAEPNKLVGKLNAPLGAKARIVFSASFKAAGHSHTLTARYVKE